MCARPLLCNWICGNMGVILSLWGSGANRTCIPNGIGRVLQCENGGVWWIVILTNRKLDLLSNDARGDTSIAMCEDRPCDC